MFKVFDFDKTLFLVTVILVLGGTIMVYSSSAIVAEEKFGNSFYFLINHIIGLILGFAILFLVIKIKYPFYKSPIFVYFFFLISIFLIILSLISPPINQAHRWIRFFGLSFQSSELAKISIVLLFAYHLDKKREKLHDFLSLSLPLVALLIVSLLVIRQPDLGTTAILIFIGGLMLFIGGARLRHLISLNLIFIPILIISILKTSYQLKRLTYFLNPEQDPFGKGFQIIQSLIAIGSGGILGKGMGESTQKLFFLPYGYTDFIFPIIGEELGLVGAVTVLVLFFVFLWRGIAISRKAPDLCSQLVSAGLTFLIVTQALINISMTLGLLPPKGIPLPFISFGRSSLVCNLFIVGIILNISQRKVVKKLKK
jgi:cell division protein FtsW